MLATVRPNDPGLLGWVEDPEHYAGVPQECPDVARSCLAAASVCWPWRRTEVGVDEETIRLVAVIRSVRREGLRR